MAVSQTSLVENMLNGHSMEVLRLWSLGVGSVIGGDFFGWNSSLRGGFGAGLLSISWAVVLYFLVARCIARLCALLPNSQGTCAFVTIGMGPQFGPAVAACEIVKLLWVLCAIGFGIVEYFLAVVHIPHTVQFVLFAVLLSGFCCLGLVGVKSLGNSQVFATVSCLVILMFYWVSVSTQLDFQKNAVPEGEWFRSWDRVLESLPFGAWFFLGFEEIPLLVPPSLTAETRANVLEKGLLYSFTTVMSSCILTYCLASGSGPGVAALRSEEAPLVEGIKSVYGDDSRVVTVFAVLSVLSLLAPFCSFFLYCIYHVQEMAEAGLIPRVFAQSNHRNVPIYALLATALSSYCLLATFALLFGEKSAEVVIPGCLVAALISAFLQLESLRRVQQRAIASEIGDNCLPTGSCEVVNDKSELTSLLVTEGFSDFSVQTKKDIPVLEIRIGQVIITTVLLCIILLACRNSSHRIGLSIAVGVLIALVAIMHFLRIQPSK